MNINLKYYIVYTLAYGIVLLIGAFMYRALIERWVGDELVDEHQRDVPLVQ